MSFAPSAAQRPIRPCAKTTTASPIFTPPDSAPLIPVEAMSVSRTTCSSATEIAKRVLQPASQAEAERALVEAITAPQLFHDFFHQFQGKPFSD